MKKRGWKKQESNWRERNLENSEDGNVNEQEEEFRDEAEAGGDIDEFEDKEEGEEEGNRQEGQVRRERQEAGAEAGREATRAEEGTEENTRSGTRPKFVSTGDVADDEDGDQDFE
jgi:hypothetical protein